MQTSAVDMFDFGAPMASQCSNKTLKTKSITTQKQVFSCSIKLFANADCYSNLNVKQSGAESASSNEPGSGQEDNVDDEDNDESDDDESDDRIDDDNSEEDSNTDNSDDDEEDDDEHAENCSNSTAEDDENSDSSASCFLSSESSEEDEVEKIFCRKCHSALHLRCDMCATLFCSNCSTKRRWHKLHPDIDYDSDEHEEAFDLAHICYHCHDEAMEDAAQCGYDEIL